MKTDQNSNKLNSYKGVVSLKRIFQFSCFFVLIIFVGYACSDSHGQSIQPQKKVKKAKWLRPGEITAAVKPAPVAVQADLGLACVEGDLQTWYGSLQGLKPEQTQETYVFGECHAGQNSFDIIWVCNEFTESGEFYTMDDLDERFDAHYFGRDNTKNGFSAYYFRLPLKDVKDPARDDPYKFPCEVKCFTNSGADDQIKHVGDTIVKSWEDYIQLQYLFIKEGTISPVKPKNWWG